MEFKFRANPNYRDTRSTKKIMLRLTIGLLLVYLFGLYHAYLMGKAYFINTIELLFAALTSAFVTEGIYAYATKQKVFKYIKNSFGWITAIILVLTVTFDTAPYAIAVSTFIALFFGKLVFGGFGQNIFNPAAVGRAILGTSFAGSKIVDALSGPTPTSTFDSAGWLVSPSDFKVFLNDFGGFRNIFLGLYDGAIGETSTIIILLIGIYFVATKVIDWTIPATYILVIFFGTAVTGIQNGLGLMYPVIILSTGGALFGAVFMLTDPVTNPASRPARITASCLAAIINVLIRFFAYLPEGFVYAVLIANMLTPAIDKFYAGKLVENERKLNIIMISIIVLSILAIAVAGSKLEIQAYNSVLALKTLKGII